MKKLMKLFDHMDEQLDSAECFAECANELKGTDDDMAADFLSIARTEVDTYDKLNNMALRHIKRHWEREQLPEAISDTCDYMKRKFAKRLGTVQSLIDSYNK